jgi:hypothetical protein
MHMVKRVTPRTWGTSNGTFATKQVGDIEIAFVDYSKSKRVRLRPDIVEYGPDKSVPLYDLIIGKETMHELGVILDFKEKTIQIDKILLPMRNIMNLQLNPALPGPWQQMHAWLRSQLAPAPLPSVWWRSGC